MEDREFFTANDDDEGLTAAELVQRAQGRGLITAPGQLERIDAPGAPAAELVTMKSRWVDVTPEKAAKWLLNNVCNRPLRRDVVNLYARQMARKEWLPIPQGIAFDSEQRLLNGQHRLQAVIESGETIRMMVTTGVPSRIAGSEVRPMDLMDTGVTRSITDQLKIQHGLSGGSVLAAIVRSLVHLCVPQRTRKMSVSEVLAVYRLFQPAIDHVMQHRSKQHGLKQAGVLAGFAMAMSAEVRHQEDFGRLNLGTNLETETPLALLRGFLTGQEAILLTRTNDRALAEIVLNVLHHERRGKKLANLVPDAAGADYYRDRLASQVGRIIELFNMERRGA